MGLASNRLHILGEHMPGKGGVDNTVRAFVREYFKDHPIGEPPGEIKTAADAAEALWNDTKKMPPDRLGVVFGNNSHGGISTTHVSADLAKAVGGKRDAVSLAKALFIDICLSYVAEDRSLQAHEIQRLQIAASLQANAF